MSKYLLFTDLDGTILDHKTYRYSQSQNAVSRLAEKQIPLIFCSSKSIAEQLYLQKELNLCLPFIVENGSAIVFPPGFLSGTGSKTSRQSKQLSLIPLTIKRVLDIQQHLDEINFSRSDDIRAYYNSTVREIMRLTGLNNEQAIHARARCFTESILSGQLNDCDRTHLESNGFTVSQGGRFETIQDKLVNKGRAVRLVIDLFTGWWGESPVSFGIGDSPNDIPMLEQVDKPFLVKNHANEWCDCRLSGLVRVDRIGPEGFVEFVHRILEYGC